jgi:EAL domain-containing protein (putative c-di-GMP-specific phosphodiesterase class I)
MNCIITASIGICLFQGEDTVEHLLKNADMAMYQAKANGRNTLRFFDPEMQAVLDKRSLLENDLRQALERNELQLYYQQQVDATGMVIGAEILLRWKHPQRHFISPADFIPLAEETGLILPIGQWVLEGACQQLKAWSGDPLAANLRLSVNVSSVQFRQDNFVESVREILQCTGIDSTRLKLELTESLILDDLEEVIDKMQALKALGVAFSLDDFGTGYSSLSYLTRLPLDELKIDQSFVSSLPGNRNDEIIVQTIITMGQSLGLRVIAEGVETAAQRDFLELHGCHAYQGYFFGRPVPLAEFMSSMLQRA